MTGNRALKLLGVGVPLALGFLVFWPAAIDPVAWTPSEPMAAGGPLATNASLRKAELLDGIAGPEDVAVDAQGRVYAGTAAGTIERRLPDGRVTTFATTGGRPLGLDWDAAGNLVVADALEGLLRVDDAGNVTTLATEAGGVPFGFTDDVDVASDGRIYFSDASVRFGVDDYQLDLLEGRPHGRLLRYDPATEQVEVLLAGLYFANGVALSRAEDFVVVCETWRYRVTRLWLEGPRAGQSEPFIEGLAGYPDGISGNGRGTFWLAQYSPRSELADSLAAHPWARKLLTRLPGTFWPGPAREGMVLALDEAGQVIHSFQDPGGTRVRGVTSVEEVRGALYLGSLTEPNVARLDLDVAVGPPPRIAITVDDLPGHHWAGLDPAEATVKLLTTFQQHHARATGFVNCDDVAPDQRILRLWLQGRYELGNHQASHSDLNKTDPDEWLDGVRLCSAMLTDLVGKPPRHFRFPYLFNGPDPQTRDRVLQQILEMGMRIARVSVDNHDWKLGELYDEARAAGDEERARAIAEQYVEHMVGAVWNYQDVARKKLGRDVDHVLLTHANGLTSEHLGRVLVRLERLGFEFITLSEALRDPVYSLPQAYEGKWGWSWLYRIAPVTEQHTWDDEQWARITGQE